MFVGGMRTGLARACTSFVPVAAAAVPAAAAPVAILAKIERNMSNAGCVSFFTRGPD